MLDRHLTGEPDGGSRQPALHELSEINQAVGVLIGRRHTRDEAIAELQRLATIGDPSVHQAALAVLDTVA